MTEPFRHTCPACGWNNGHAPTCVYRVPAPSTDLRCLLAAYVALRRECIGIEELIETSAEPGNGTLTAADLKRMDKAVTVMKAGFKMVKKVLCDHEVPGTASWREPFVATPAAKA